MITNDTTPVELAALISEALQAAGVTAVLSGGAAVQIYSGDRYVSRDLDFVTPASHRELAPVLATLGFEPTRNRRLYAHPETDYLVEFPAWPLSVGDEPIGEWAALPTASGVIQIITATQCVQDRLAAYFYWQDPQALEQAVLVARHQPIDIETVLRWAEAEGETERFRVFEAVLRQTGRHESD